MDTMSPELEREIERRLAAGSYGCVDELLADALRALDDAQGVANAILEKELLQGLEGDDVEMTPTEWRSIKEDAIKILDTKHAR